MPYRDPETGQFVSDDGENHRHRCFNDHVTVTFSLEVDAQGGNNDDDWHQRHIDLPTLDNDELAELTYLSAGLAARNDPEAASSNTSPGTINAVAEIGANLGSSEFLIPDGSVPNFSNGESSDSDAVLIATTGGATDNAGHFGILTATADAAYQDTGSGTGGGGGVSTDRFEKDFRSVYGEGPWLDATDDMVARVWVNKNTTDSDGRGHLVGQAVYRLVEDDNCRPSFGLR